jgi:hypothetical protein
MRLIDLDLPPFIKFLMFPLVNSEPGDLIFFHRLPSYQDASSSNFENAVISSSTLNADIFHIALLVEPNIYTIVHSTPTYGTAVFLAKIGGNSKF